MPSRTQRPIDLETHWRVSLERLHADRCRAFRVRLPPPAISITERLPEGVLGRYLAEGERVEMRRSLFEQPEWAVVEGVFLHEMAHQLQRHAPAPRRAGGAHGLSFALACERIGVPHEFRDAFSRLEDIQARFVDQRRMEARDTTLRRLEKLRALIESPGTPAEQETATRLLEALMKGANVEELRRAQPIGRWLLATGKVNATVEKDVCGLICRLAPVTYVTWRRPTVLRVGLERVFEFWGRREHLAYAEYLWDCLWRFVEASSAPAGVNPLTWRRNLVYGIAARLAPIGTDALATSAEERALVVANDAALERAYRGLHPRVGRGRGIAPGALADDAAAELGARAAEFTLRRPVEGSRERARGRLLLR